MALEDEVRRVAEMDSDEREFLAMDLWDEVKRLRAGLKKIADADEVTLMCDPLGSQRIARSLLKVEV